MARKRVKPRPTADNLDQLASPSSPMKPPTVNLWLKYGEDMGRLQIHCFCERWAVYDALTIALNGRDYAEVDSMGWYETDDEELRFRLVGDVEDLLEEKPTQNWVPSEPILSQLNLAAGIITQKPVPDKSEEMSEVNRRKRKPKGAPVSKEGLVSIGEICEELKMNPRDARKILRNKVEKPDAGWAWDKDEALKIKKILKS